MEKMDPNTEIKNYLENYMRKNATTTVVPRLKNGTMYPLHRDDAALLIDVPTCQLVAAGAMQQHVFDSDSGARWTYLNSLLTDKYAYFTPRIELNFEPATVLSRSYSDSGNVLSGAVRVDGSSILLGVGSSDGTAIADLVAGNHIRVEQGGSYAKGTIVSNTATNNNYHTIVIDDMPSSSVTFTDGEASTVIITPVGDAGSVTVRLSEGSTELGNRVKTFGADYTSQSNKPDLTLSTGLDENSRITRLSDDLTISIEPTGANIDVSNVKLIPEIRADGYRIIPSKRVPSFRPQEKSGSDLSTLKQGEIAVTFFEQRGNKDPYFGTVDSLFVFRVWADPLPDARKLWAVLDSALHDKNRVKFNNLNVYYSLRAAVPEMDFEDEVTYPDAFNFISAYNIAYWEYENERQ